MRTVRWSRPGCPELVAGSGKQVEVRMMATDVHGNLSRMGHVTRRAPCYNVTPECRRIKVQKTNIDFHVQASTRDHRPYCRRNQR
jgi:hypothetical protein